MTSRKMPTAAVLEKRSSKKPFSAAPMMAAGIEPITSQKNTRRQYLTPSLPMSFGRNKALTMLAMSWMKKPTTATKVPRCSSTSNATVGAGMLNNWGTITRCAELETGRNSVTPCTSPSMRA